MPGPRSNMSYRGRNKKSLVNEDEDTDIEDIDMDAVTDSEEEKYTETEKRLLEKVRKRHTSENYDSDDQVYTLQGDSEDEEEEEEDNQPDSMESDIEQLQEDYDIPDDRAWGKKARSFYSSDYKYTDYATATQKDFENAEMEDQEAKRLYTRLASENFEIIDDRFTQSVEDDKDDGKMEFSKSQKNKQVLEQNESNVFVALITDFKEHIIEVKEILLPFLKLVENGTCPDCDAVTFIRTKYHVLLNYFVNISFYLMLKTKGLPIRSHPVVKRLEQYRQLLAQLQWGQGDLLEKVVEILNAVKSGKPLYNILDGSQRLSQKLSKAKISRLANLSKKLSRRKEITVHEQEELLPDSTDIMDSTKEEDECTNEENLENTTEMYDIEDREDKKDTATLDATNENEKRAITYQIAKNRGLTPHRKKDQRNPRVVHRKKYRKAMIRRKGAVREVRKELTRYAGEISGIKVGAVRSIKLK